MIPVAVQEFFCAHRDEGQLTYECLAEGFYLPYVLLLTVALLASRAIFRPFCMKYMLRKYKIPDKKKIIVSDSIWYTLGILQSFTFGVYITWDKEWFWENYNNCFAGYPHFSIESQLRMYYTYSLSFYVAGAILTLVDEKKKDFAAMLGHHIVTILLIFWSGCANMHRIGLVIMLTFDISDIFLELAKIFHRLNHNLLSDLNIYVFLGVWLKYRMYNYPVYAMATAFSGVYLANHPIPFISWLLPCLTLIMILQIYWTYFILMKIKAMFTNAPGGDPREKEEDDD